jgi:hypothetical protein
VEAVALLEHVGGDLVDSHGHEFNETAVKAPVPGPRSLVRVEELQSLPSWSQSIILRTGQLRTHLRIKVHLAYRRLGQEFTRNLQGAGTQRRMAGDRVAPCLTVRVDIEGVVRQGQAINDLAIGLQRQICAKDIPDSAVEDSAVLGPQYHI